MKPSKFQHCAKVLHGLMRNSAHQPCLSEDNVLSKQLTELLTHLSEADDLNQSDEVSDKVIAITKLFESSIAHVDNMVKSEECMFDESPAVVTEINQTSITSSYESYVTLLSALTDLLSEYKQLTFSL